MINLDEITILMILVTAKNADAMNHLGISYELGTKTKQDFVVARQYYASAAEANSIHGQYNYARMCAIGKGGVRDEYQAFLFYEKAALRGHIDALNNLGHCYEQGVGIKKNLEMALQCFDQAKESGHVLASQNYKNLLRKLFENFSCDRLRFSIKSLRNNHVKLTFSARQLGIHDENIDKSSVYFAENDLKLLGSGSSGAVYRAELKFINDDPQIVAIKENRLVNKLLDQKFVSDETIKKFETEIDYLSKLNHPNIIQMIGICQFPLLLIIEYMPLGTLFENLQLKSMKINTNQKLSIALDISSALIYLHEKKIIHGDLKSENILLDWGFRAKLADFSHSMPYPTESTQCCGTNGWRAPELVNSDKKDMTTIYYYNEKIDIYSFGVVLWELFARKFLRSQVEQNFSSNSDKHDIKKIYFNIIGNHQKLFLENPHSIKSQSLKCLIHYCWMNNPSSRPQAQDIFNKMINTII